MGEYFHLVKGKFFHIENSSPKALKGELQWLQIRPLKQKYEARLTPQSTMLFTI